MLSSKNSKALITEGFFFFPFYDLPKAKVDLLAHIMTKVSATGLCSSTV